MRRRVASPPIQRRLGIAAVAALLSATLAYLHARSPGRPPDFTQLWFAAHAVLQGEDPYLLIGRGRAFEWQNGFFYPLPAAILAMPFAGLSAAGACAVFMGLGVGCLAWAFTRQGYAPLLGLFALPTLFAVEVAQWSPLLVASLVLPVLGVALVAKPTIGAALFVARPSWWSIVGALLLLAASFAIQPGWIVEWRDAVRETSVGGGRVPYTAPVLLPGGPLALVAALRWRRPEARLIVALACAPQTTLFYEALPLLLVPDSWWESATLLVGSHLAQWLVTNEHAGPVRDYYELIAANGRAMVWCLYLPATFIVLRRANEGGVPRWLESRIEKWPGWLRGGAPAGA